MTEDSLIELMVGRTLGEQFGKVSSVREEVVLSVEGLGVKGQCEGVSFELRKGEVLGIAGLVGAGRTELLECIFGATRPSHGRVLLDGKRVKIHSPADAVRIGIGLVPEERRSSGLVLDRSVAHNISFPILNRVSRLALVSFQKLMGVAQDFANRLNIRTPSLHQRVRNLSGGNQQKVVLAKWLAAGVKVLLLDEPTRGIDVGAKAEIYHQINQLASEGVAIIMASSELPEVLGMSDRILVMAEGRMIKELVTSETDQIEIMKYAVVDSSLKTQIEITAA
jgi:ABC-type sugar transport system ATPase subunit